VPKANEEFEDFLVSSQSSICDKDNESCATALDVLTPFQRLHLTPLHALVILTREKMFFFHQLSQSTFQQKLFNTTSLMSR
jgi:hypothetical protein